LNSYPRSPTTYFSKDLENILIQWTKARSGFNTRKRGRRRRRRRTVTVNKAAYRGNKRGINVNFVERPHRKIVRRGLSWKNNIKISFQKLKELKLKWLRIGSHTFQEPLGPPNYGER
jgi:hypothetical protein